MEITFLGAGAAEGYPSPLCDCANRAGARARGGHDLRGRSAALINNDLLIDLEPGRVVAHHFSHWHNPGHADLEAYFDPRGVRVAYDGRRLTL